MSTTYSKFGSLIARARHLRGIATQGDLAKLVGTSQQSVSRWEAGTSRPGLKQLTKIGEVLGIQVHELRTTAGYGDKEEVVSFDRPFPFEGLTPETFERFTADLLQSMYPENKVHRAGGQGHTQHGTDVVMAAPTGKKWSFQCKQVAEFGPQKVKRAVLADTTDAQAKVLVLSRVASPDARAAIDSHGTWELWDRDDLSRKIRQLPLNEQRRFVRLYFNSQYEALLGVPGGEAWETPEDFFKAFEPQEKLFNHAWSLIGRQSLAEEITEALETPETNVVILSGAGGNGKTRLLKSILDDYASTHPSTKIRIAATTGEISKTSLEELGTGELLLVVDDAHDRDDLQPLFAHAAVNSGRAKLVIAARPYGISHIKAQASSYSFVEGSLNSIDIPPLPREASEELARHILERLKGPSSMAKQIADLTHGCTLATVVGARIVAEHGVHPAFVQNENRFRETLFGRFEDIVTGRLAGRENPDHVRKVLGFIALLQPIALDDRQLVAALEIVDSIGPDEVQRIFRLLVDAGALFKRGAKHRLSPDILGDYLIEARFERHDGKSNGLAERYFDAIPPRYIENLLVNLGRIEWRRTGQASDSPLLDGIWARLNPASAYSDPHIKAVEAVAYYQPKKALAFAEKLIREGRFASDLTGIAKYAAYSQEYFGQAIECLWEIGRNDSRDLGQHPSHAIRILKEMCEPSPNKPYWVVDGIIDFGVAASSKPEAWTGRFTPFDVLDGILQTEGHTSSMRKHTWSMSPYFVDPDSVAEQRKRVIDLLVESLTETDRRKAVSAAVTLAHALRRPIGILGASPDPALRSKWDTEFEQTLHKIAKVVKANTISIAVQTEIGRSIRWQERHGTEGVREAARAVRLSLSSGPEATMERLLTGGYSHAIEDDGDEGDFGERWSRFVIRAVNDLKAAYPTPSDLVERLEVRLHQLGEDRRSATPEVLIGALVENWVGFAQEVVRASEDGTALHIAKFNGSAVGRLFREDRTSARVLMERLLKSEKPDLRRAVAIAYANQRYSDDWVIKADIDNIEQLVTDHDEGVRIVGIHAIRSVCDWNRDTAMSLVRKASILTAREAEEVATLLTFREQIPPEMITQADAEHLLEKMRPIPELDGHWLELLLVHFSQAYPWELARFFMQRVEDAAELGDGRIRPCNYGPWAHQPLRFRKSPEGAKIMREVAAWMRRNNDRAGMFSYDARNLFEAMFAPFDEEIVGFLSEWLRAADQHDLETIATILREADRDFVFREVSFVVDLVETARQFGSDVLRLVESELYCSAISGLKSGTAGQPFPEDIQLKENSVAVLAQLSRFSPAFELYESLREHAEQQISRALRDAEEDEE